MTDARLREQVLERARAVSARSGDRLRTLLAGLDGDPRVAPPASLATVGLDDAERADALHGAEVSAAARRAAVAVSGPGLDDCEDCDAAISEARRRAHPAARRCVHCQSAAERRRGG